jgi:hypothetical protein
MRNDVGCIGATEYCRTMADDPVKDAFEELKEEFNEFRGQWGEILAVVSEVDQCKPGDDLAKAMEKLEAIVHKVRTGGVFGAGVNDYDRALKNWKEAGNAK